ncbi:cytochrome c peroxidase [Sphingobacterium thalpophilum]|uniref:Methylamine utilization protein MauG n=2 Tax=Sphingobacteriaceae TaxID=84566 RepID=A0A4U9UFY5_9SPHI|nr:cytochrome c peroxidase [Sphingobacterium thalpophilum]MCW8313828.1 cytochrome-c peroxidase [Sphingobacterium sp. InxBP1]VTR28161.1 Cytochrome c551 peroxidase precursor [Sphingobacterium thalpophilum]
MDFKRLHSMKKKTLMVIAIFIAPLLISAFANRAEEQEDLQELRKRYSSGRQELWPKPHIDASVRSNFTDIGVLPPVSYPADNPYSKEKSLLGKLLFFDPRLSASKQISCASCHDPQLGFGDGKSLAHGHGRREGKRNAMTLYNVAFYRTFMWDGRAKSLEDQVLLPTQDPVEMNTPLDTLVAHVKAVPGYAGYFEQAFGDKQITLLRIQQALATFERGIVSYPTKFDRFVQGQADALNDQELTGLHLFRTKARCINCHNTPLFSDNLFHNDGQTLYGTKQQDFGHYHLTGNQKDIGAFRTPSLRNVGLTGPWMHHGNFPTLRDVVELYNLGNPAPIQRHVKIDEKTRPIHSPLLKKLNLSRQEVDAVIAFLQALSTPTQRRIAMPELPQ